MGTGVSAARMLLRLNVWADFTAFNNAAADALSALCQFERTMREAMLREYLREHRRPPGSERTKRLRKKRADRVAAWWSAHV